jgi:hypothetical protein
MQERQFVELVHVKQGDWQVRQVLLADIAYSPVGQVVAHSPLYKYPALHFVQVDSVFTHSKQD